MIIFAGKDDYANLSTLKKPEFMPFTGKTLAL
jgi:hypothetical protein